MKRENRTIIWWLLPVLLVVPISLVGLFYLLQDNRELMNTWVFGVMAPLEQALGRLWSWAPFSVAEVLAAISLAGSLGWLIWSGVGWIRSRNWQRGVRRLLALAAVWLWLWCGLCWLWNAAYYADTFAQRSGLESTPYSTEELAAVTAWFARQAAELSGQVSRDEEGHFARELGTYFSGGPAIYENLAREFPCLDIPSVRAKPLLCSKLQSALGFTGVYFPFTGEANVNVDTPACLIPATIAHEMAHQRMVASELEANFVGIAACVTSDSVVFQYSGYLMGLIQLCNALYPVDAEGWQDIVQTYFTPELSTDWEDNNAYWAAFASPVGDTAEQVYDSFLKGNDQELGVRSYGACVDLLVAYFLPNAD